MAKRRRRTSQLKWKHLGFTPEGCDDSRTSKYGDPGFLYLCQELRDDWRRVRGYTIKNLRHRPGQRGCNSSFDWTGLDDALSKAGADIGPPPCTVRLGTRALAPEEREALGREAHRNWVAVRKQQRVLGQAVPDEELRAWDELSDEQKEVFRRSAESLALPERAMWDAVAVMRQKMGEKSFRRKMFEISVSVAFEKMAPAWTEAERYRATDIIVNLSEMLYVPPPADPVTGVKGA